MKQNLKLSREEILAFHRSIFVANVHGDYGIEVAKAREQKGKRGQIRDVHVPRMRDGGVDFEFYTIGGDDIMFTQDKDLTLGSFRSIDHAYQEIYDEVSTGTLCLTSKDVERAKNAGEIGFMFTMEGAGPIQEDLSLLRNYYKLGLRSIILTWFKANLVADGVGEIRNGGLSEFGKLLIEEMDHLGMIIDITQSAPASIEDVFDISRKPIIASHSNAAGYYPHRRNLTDKQIKALAKSGGLIGVTCYPAHVSENPSLEEFFNHIDYCVNLGGIETVGIGLNIVVHSQEDAVDFYERSNIEYSDMSLPQLENLEKFAVITEGLFARGYSEDHIKKIMGGNLLRVMREVID
jgi:membrane dipeptidase